MLTDSTKRSGSWPTLARATAVLAVLTLAACNYGLRGGGGFPAHVRSIYIEPFENRTPQFDLEQQLFAAVLARVPPGLGIRPAGRDAADAVLRGRITRYDDLAENIRTDRGGDAATALQHQVYIGVAIQIVDVRNNVILWEAQSLLGQGAYDPLSQTDQEGRMRAIEQVVQKIIEGAQSQW
jgi:hypothetical protein